MGTRCVHDESESKATDRGCNLSTADISLNLATLFLYGTEIKARHRNLSHLRVDSVEVDVIKNDSHALNLL